MTATFIQRGDSIDHVPEEDIAAGQIVVIGDLVGIAKLDIKAGTRGALALTGIFTIPKWTGAVDAGTKMYWDTEAATTDADDGSGNALPYIGKSVYATVNADTTIVVRLCP